MKRCRVTAKVIGSVVPTDEWCCYMSGPDDYCENRPEFAVWNPAYGPYGGTVVCREHLPEMIDTSPDTRVWRLEGRVDA